MASKRNINYRLILISLIYILFSCTRHYLLQSGVYDLGLFTQWLHLINSGLFWEPSSLSDYVKPPLGDHFSLGLLPISLIYSIFPSAYTILIIQSIGLGILVELFLTQFFHLIPQQKHSLLLAPTIIFTPVIFNSNLNDFHPEIAFAPFAFLALIALRNGKLLNSFLLLVCFIATKEAMALFGISYSVYAFLRKHRMYSFFIFIFSLIYFKISSEIVSEYQNYAMSRYSQLGDSYLDIVTNIIMNPSTLLSEIVSQSSIEYLLFLGLPFIALILLPGATHAIISTAPLLLSNILSTSEVMRNPIYQYHLPITVFILVAILDGLNSPQKLTHQSILSSGTLKSYRIYLQIILAALSFLIFTQYGNFFTSYPHLIETAKDVRRVSVELNDPVLRIWAHERIAPHFSSRAFIEFKQDRLLTKQYDYVIYPQYKEANPPSSFLIKLRNLLFSYGESQQFVDSSRHIQLLRKHKYSCMESGSLYVCKNRLIIDNVSAPTQPPPP